MIQRTDVCHGRTTGARTPNTWSERSVRTAGMLSRSAKTWTVAGHPRRSNAFWTLRPNGVSPHEAAASQVCGPMWIATCGAATHRMRASLKARAPDGVAGWSATDADFAVPASTRARAASSATRTMSRSSNHGMDNHASGRSPSHATLIAPRDSRPMSAVASSRRATSIASSISASWARPSTLNEAIPSSESRASTPSQASSARPASAVGPTTATRTDASVISKDPDRRSVMTSRKRAAGSTVSAPSTVQTSASGSDVCRRRGSGRPASGDVADRSQHPFDPPYGSIREPAPAPGPA